MDHVFFNMKDIVSYVDHLVSWVSSSHDRLDDESLSIEPFIDDDYCERFMMDYAVFGNDDICILRFLRFIDVSSRNSEINDRYVAIDTKAHLIIYDAVYYGFAIYYNDRLDVVSVSLTADLKIGSEHDDRDLKIDYLATDSFRDVFGVDNNLVWIYGGVKRRISYPVRSYTVGHFIVNVDLDF